MPNEPLEVIVDQENVRIDVFGNPDYVEPLFYALLEDVDPGALEYEKVDPMGAEYFNKVRSLLVGKVTKEAFSAAYSNPFTLHLAGGFRLHLGYETDTQGELKPKMIFRTNWYETPRMFKCITQIFNRAMEKTKGV